MSERNQIRHGIEQVVERGMCIGCGACAIRTGGAIAVTLGSRGLYQANLATATSEQISLATRVCPFSDAAKNEDALASERFGDLPHDDRIGHYSAVMAGRLTEDDSVVQSSSGGLATRLLSGLLERRVVDSILHVGRSDGSELFEYVVSSSVDELLSARKSMYYATTLAEVGAALRPDKRYAVVGVPCFIKAMRLLADEVPALNRQLAFFVGIVCGHLKSTFFAESLAWQAGVPPSSLETVDFRVKNPTRAANRYDYSATARTGERVVRPVASAIDGSWGYAAFQPEACNFCDDVFAETADVVFGDAWLEQYQRDWRGTNIVVTRDARATEILRAAEDTGAVVLTDLGPDEAARSQAGNFRHRRVGLRVRLADDIAAGLSVPIKRVSPSTDGVSRGRIRLIRQRRDISRMSLEWFEQARATNDLDHYIDRMRTAIARYQRVDAAQRGPIAILRYLVRKVRGTKR
ncbi:Coenzyme F420 hydrogenase/dehydrogenase, beta subunit C-terminal domain [Agromyces larvae]|uniref:Coenzyme F420 hydrogenase/dehydrogenase, beta subunit C-terminal domain n=1 Tax=Agromyces larvae TaxID=2929802 RepID=A0ABY4C2R4_9MICO|nr:Coenzyme F420 hydrogenase/dehydrogenase, beta subunit C-terminal domain [Agromyces larvae]UOE44306.1 Coenzyme F420 hydrogenase/dehydrogenase, beta subunit C-terminal domain [Agromyces larvae]